MGCCQNVLYLVRPKVAHNTMKSRHQKVLLFFTNTCHTLALAHTPLRAEMHQRWPPKALPLEHFGRMWELYESCLELPKQTHWASILFKSIVSFPVFFSFSCFLPCSLSLPLPCPHSIAPRYQFVCSGPWFGWLCLCVCVCVCRLSCLPNLIRIALLVSRPRPSKKMEVTTRMSWKYSKLSSASMSQQSSWRRSGPCSALGDDFQLIW